MAISCRIGFLRRLDLYKSESGEKPFSINIPLDHLPDARQSNVEYNWVEDIEVTDIRGRESQFSLDIHGFEVVQQTMPYTYSDFEDTALITRNYVKHMENWMKEHFQAEEVLIFDHQVRRRNPVFAQRRGESEQPITGAHVDESPKGHEAQYEFKVGAKGKPFASLKRCEIINAWRPLFGPCEDFPLAFCDYRSVNVDDDFEKTDIVYPNLESENFSVYHNEIQKWYFLSRMMPIEVILLKQADTKSGTATCCPHAAIKDPTVGENVRMRESIEAGLRVVECLIGINSQSVMSSRVAAASANSVIVPEETA